MDMKLYNESDIQNIADAIREKNGTQDKYKVSEMAQAIEDISGGIDAYAFFQQHHDPTDLSQYSLAGITELRKSAFSGFAELANISLPSGLTKIGDLAFSGCNDLALTSLPDGVTSIGDYAFNGCGSLILNSLPSALTSIGQYAFGSCPVLALTSLPSGLTSIGQYAFLRCSRLALTSIPDGVTKIDTSTFEGCGALAMISLPQSVSNIGFRAFYECKSLKTVLCNATNPPTLGSYAFNNTHADLAIYVPDASVSAYQSATNWSTYASKIHPMSEYTPS